MSSSIFFVVSVKNKSVCYYKDATKNELLQFKRKKFKHSLNLWIKKSVEEASVTNSH